MLWKGRRKEDGVLNKEIPAFIFFLLLSFIFWYLNELSKELETTLSYPVRYVNPPKERIIIGEMPHKLAMRLRGPGYSILKMKLSGSKAPVVIDFSKVAPKRLPGKRPHYCLVTSGLIEDFSKQLHADFEILSIKPDTLFFAYDRLVMRKMPVLPVIRSEISPTNKVVVVAEPDSVIVTGPEHIMDTIAGIRTKFRSFRRMDETFKTSVSLECPQYLEASEKRVVLEITVLDKPASFFNLKSPKSKPD